MSLESMCMIGDAGHIIIHVIGLPHCPRNRSHAIMKKGKASFLGKTEAARSYEKALKFHLEKYKHHMEFFCGQFDPKTQHLHATWEFASPDLRTKERAISRNSTDLDAHKVLQDTVMEMIGIDDAYIVRDTRTKMEGDYRVSLSLQIKDNDPVDGEELL